MRGNFHAPNYLVNANHAINCGQPIDDLHAYDTIGLIVGGQVDTTNTNVHGDSYVAGGGTIDQLHSLDAGCTVHSPVTAYAFDWDTVQNGAISASVRLASYAPNIVLQGEGAVSNVGGDGQNAYYIFTFDTCPTCDITGPLSDSSAILFGQGNYNGPTGDVPTEDSTVVFNVSVYRITLVSQILKHTASLDSSSEWCYYRSDGQSTQSGLVQLSNYIQLLPGGHSRQLCPGR